MSCADDSLHPEDFGWMVGNMKSGATFVGLGIGLEVLTVAALSRSSRNAAGSRFKLVITLGAGYVPAQRTGTRPQAASAEVAAASGARFGLRPVDLRYASSHASG